MNQQREVLYDQRRKILTKDSLKDTVMEMVDTMIKAAMDQYADEKLYPEQWDYDGLYRQMKNYFLTNELMTREEMEEYGRTDLLDELIDIAHDEYDKREEMIGSVNMRELEKAIMLRVVDNKWMEHLDAMDMLRDGIGLRSYGQRNPIVEYKFEAYDMFQEMIAAIQDDTLMYLYRIQINPTDIEQEEAPVDHLEGAQTHHEDVLEPGNN